MVMFLSRDAGLRLDLEPAFRRRGYDLSVVGSQQDADPAQPAWLWDLREASHPAAAVAEIRQAHPDLIVVALVADAAMAHALLTSAGGQGQQAQRVLTPRFHGAPMALDLTLMLQERAPDCGDAVLLTHLAQMRANLVSGLGERIATIGEAVKQARASTAPGDALEQAFGPAHKLRGVAGSQALYEVSNAAAGLEDTARRIASGQGEPDWEQLALHVTVIEQVSRRYTSAEG